METLRLPEDTLNPEGRAGSARAPSAATTMADKQGAFRHVGTPASAAEDLVVVEGFTAVAAEDLTEAAVAGGDNRSFVMFLADRGI